MQTAAGNYSMFTVTFVYCIPIMDFHVKALQELIFIYYNIYPTRYNIHTLFYLETALYVSGATITHHQERKQLYLQHLVFVTPLLLSAAIVEELEPV